MATDDDKPKLTTKRREVQQALDRLLTLKEASAETGIPIKSLRMEVLDGRLKCYRARPGRTAPILLKPRDIAEWLEQHAGRRQFADAPQHRHRRKPVLPEGNG